MERIIEFDKIRTKSEFFEWLNYIYPATIGDLQLPQIVDQFVDSIKEECAKEAGEYFDMDLYEKFCEANKGRFHSGQFSEREMVMEFIAENITDKK